MKIQWCWRCQENVPMLNDIEHALCLEARAKGKTVIEKEIAIRQIENYEWLKELPSVSNVLRYYIEMHKLITGVTETNPNIIAHHIIAYYGPECPNCSKPLRSKKAGYCAECGFGMADYKKDRRSIIQREPQLFK